jgi:hypothetical protein
MTSTGTDPRLISMKCHGAQPGANYSWHSHPFHEFTLVTEDVTRIGYAAGERLAQPNTLFLYRPGERHGAWTTPRQAPCYWVVHFVAGPTLCPILDRLAEVDPCRRVWQLTPDQTDAFKWLCLQILNEQTQQRNHFDLAQSSWLRLLLLSVQRWAAGESPLLINRDVAQPELLRLWQQVNAAAENPAEMLHQICLLPNYDSLRHSFKKVFGCSPREMILRLRMERAKNLLLETGLSIKEIAARSGYARQHEFARAFHRRVGLPPSQWRLNPFQMKQAAPGFPALAKRISKAAKDAEPDGQCNQYTRDQFAEI